MQRLAMYKTILVPFDGSVLSARALPIAVALARRTGATLQLALVHDPSAYIPFVPGEVAIPVYDVELVSEHRKQDQAALDDAVAGLMAQGISATGVLLEGTIVEALVEHAQSSGVDLTVMTSHGRSGFERLRLGSVATAYLTRATAPVYLVRGSGSDAPPELPVGTLLCTLDGSPFAEAILPHAKAFADAVGLTMALLSVAVPHAMPMAPFGAETLLADDSAIALEEAGRRDYLTRMAANCPLGTEVHAVTDMSVSRAIIDEATRTSAGALAMATHGRGGLKRMMLGSVADEVIRHTHAPVLVYRPS
ncbi:universal stress protein [Gemmatimonas sp.]|uniref:universal stress protein n=1 Tax=Gemmatimonas sp. TaxID=1962908 RepID=UPI00286D46CD|nr:universal stress protein [Gemmatimonas sp.]